jgi:hypothetical protein
MEKKEFTTTKWETFEGQQYGSRSRLEPRVTINKRGVFILNHAAYEALEQTSAVEFLLDSRRGVIGLKQIDPRKKNAFAIKLVDKNRRGRRIHAAAFCRHHRLKFDRTMLFDPVEIDNDGTMVLDLKKIVEVGRGAR